MGQDPIVVVGAKRTPFGAFGGALKDLSATDLAVQSSKACLEHNQISPDCIDHITFGNVIPSSSDAAYLARHVGLKIGAPLSTPALTLNRLCGSGFEAITDGIRRLKLDEATVVLAGGTENMSQAPFTLRKSRFGYRMGHGEIEDTLVAGLFDSFAKLPMALTAERLAEKYGISREECDAFALESHHKAQAAYVKGLMGPELGEISVSAKGTDHVFSKDEHLRPDASLESLKKLKPVFKEDGVVTAGNASGICDGSASVVLTRKSHADQMGWKTLARIEADSVVGCEPKEMGLGPVPAVQKILTKTGLSPSAFKMIEINEAFAAQVLAVQKELSFARDRLNIDGGAIALGHPLAASGARLVVHLISRLSSLGGGYGLASACIGGGQGMALLLKVE